MFANLTGWHFLIVLAVVGLVVAGLVVLIVFVARRSSSTTPATTAAQQSSQTSARLASLDQLKAAGQISPEEYAAKRDQILREL